uniref:Portal protein n=1 Tax=Ackermannviridae sp. TaxID=2831612 RepID=A0A8S5RQX3_9CAUD|nr:MAG TPA: Portal protein [Ackermannviridae sp.]
MKKQNVNDEKNENLEKWQGRLASARSAYSAELDKMRKREKMYYGSHEIINGKKQATNVRNAVYELIESQVDTSVPQPKVTAIHKEDTELAKRIENALRNEMRRMSMTQLNDSAERTVPVQGGDFYHVEWNPAAGYHCTLGDVEVSLRHPRQVIPQPGIYRLEDMDYVFVQISRSKEALQAKYGITLTDDTEETPEARGDTETHTGVVTQNLVYYKHDHGTVGLFSWVGDQVLEDHPDYYARTAEVCVKCGRKRVGDTCVCGGKKFKQQPSQTVTLMQDITLASGEVLPAQQYGEDEPIVNPDGSVQRDEETGEVILMPGELVNTEIPAYKPKGFPLILRVNVGSESRFLGVSDVDIIADQQQAINKYGTKIQEKLLKGGSYVTLPDGVDIDKSDSELKILRLRDPSQKAMIDVINVQPNVSNDQNMLELNYQWMKSTIGITDAFQGKYDSSAVSGSAKQFSANQSAGRLQSKREMKNAAYARLYRMMFEFLLAYADEPYPVTETDTDGEQQFGHFDRYEFLKRDAAGELYWNDEFLFEVDPASNLASNRERLWDMIDVKYQAGGFGPITELQSQYLLWTLLKETNFPYAGTMQSAIKKRLDAQAMQPMPTEQNTEVTGNDMV